MNYEELKLFLNKNTITEEIKILLTTLIKELENYKFQPNKKNGYGDNQNKTNKQILSEIKYITPLIINYLNNINFDIKINKSPKYIEKLIYLKNSLDISIKYLTESKEEYFDTWEQHKKYGGYINLIGKNNKNWKKERNNACKNILNLYKELHIINNSILNKQKDIDLNIINNSQNYFCYLNNNEKQNIKNLKK